MKFMLKSLAPVLGDFTGNGQLEDGTEVDCSFHGEEIIPDVCYGFRFHVRDDQGDKNISNAYIVLSHDNDGQVTMHYIDGRDRMKEMHSVRTEKSGADGDGRRFIFEAYRHSGGTYTFTMDVISAQDCTIKLESLRAGATDRHLVWEIALERKHSPLHIIRAA